jgi:cytochrome bd ubiquinol oxidase subunit II
VLSDVPAVLMLVGLTAYAVLAGADFGAGFWTVAPGGTRGGADATRAHARHAIGPVWEANHVWLIFVLVVCWTCYPVAFGSITSTLCVPLLIAAVGIIFRGSTYALRGQLDDTPGRRWVEILFAASSILTPFALGTVIGAIASGRVPVGNARGDLVTSWLNPTSITIGALAVVTGIYLAAVYLAADARRLAEPALERDFRTRALLAGIVAGAVALAALPVIRSDARPIWDGLTHGAGLVTIFVSAAAGITTLALVARSRFGPARVGAALAVAAIIAGWAVAQEPTFLPGLTIDQAAAGRTTLVATLIAVAAGSIVLVPSLALLFALFLHGRFDPRASAPPTATGPISRAPTGRAATAAVALIGGAAGTGFLVFGDNAWAKALGVACLTACAVSTFILASAPPGESAPHDQ